MEKRSWRQWGEIKDSAMAEISFQQYLEEKFEKAQYEVDLMLYRFVKKYRICKPIGYQRLINQRDWENAIFALPGVNWAEITHNFSKTGDRHKISVTCKNYETLFIRFEVIQDLKDLANCGPLGLKYNYEITFKDEKISHKYFVSNI